MSKTHQERALAALKGSLGDWKRDRTAGARASEHEGGRPTRPSHLSKLGKKEWNKLVKQLLERGTLTRADASILELHCELYVRHRACLDEIEKRGAFEDTADGRVESAASKLATKLAGQLRQTLIQLGLTPAAREKAKRVMTPVKDEPIPGTAGWYLQQNAEDLANLSDKEEEEPLPVVTDEMLENL